MTATAALHDDLRAVMDVVRAESPSAYTIGADRRELPADVPDDEREAALSARIASDVYASLYVRPQRTGSVHTSISTHRDFVNRLSAANTGAGTWEPGWHIVCEADDGSVEVRKDDVSFWVSPDELRTSKSGFVRGEFCRVRIGKELRQLVPGFYVAIGDGNPAAGDDDSAAALVRVYWNLTADAAIDYVATTTRMFNDARIPFRTKVLSDPKGYLRADGGVLYVERRHFGRAEPIVERIREQIAAGLRDDVPMFARRLAAGLGFAEDPGDGRSFGQSRSDLTARAVVRCYAAGETEAAARAAILGDEFRRVGLAPDRPWLTHL